ncbi:MAG: molecular chaperone DnaK, partial [Myxococcales bacterium]|nr:molecular chaperone DnaK [Myxococcales bacterium]
LGESDMIRLAGSLERVSPETKAKIGGWLVKRLDQHDENLQTWWAVGRLGARVPFYGSAHQVVPKHVVMQWLEIALRFDWRDAPEAAFAATLMARVSGDRERDLDEPIRKRVAERLMMSAQSESWQKMVLEVTQLEEADERRIFGDALPPGLRLLE